MSTKVLAGIAALVTVATVPAAAQVRVSADVVIGSGPVIGHVIVGNRVPNVYPHRYPARRVVVYQPRVIVVERHRHYRHARPFDRFRNHGWRETRVWYDSRRREYYDGFRPGLRAVVVYQRGGRYYDDYHD